MTPDMRVLALCHCRWAGATLLLRDEKRDNIAFLPPRSQPFQAAIAGFTARRRCALNPCVCWEGPRRRVQDVGKVQEMSNNNDNEGSSTSTIIIVIIICVAARDEIVLRSCFFQPRCPPMLASPAPT